MDLLERGIETGKETRIDSSTDYETLYDEILLQALGSEGDLTFFIERET